jgi:hypothetical protein
MAMRVFLCWGCFRSSPAGGGVEKWNCPLVGAAAGRQPSLGPSEGLLEIACSARVQIRSGKIHWATAAYVLITKGRWRLFMNRLPECYPIATGPVNPAGRPQARNIETP